MRFPVRQLELLLAPPGGQARGTRWRCRRGAAGTTRHHSGVRIRDNAPSTAAVGPLREVRAAHPTVSVDDLSLQRVGGHNIVAQDLELASTCMARDSHQ